VANKRPSWFAIAAAVFSIALLIFSAFTVARTLATINWRDLRAAIEMTGMQQFAGAALFALGSFAAWTGYDELAVKHLGLAVRYRTAALAAFACYSISNMLGFAVVTGTACRYWLYAQVGVSGGQVARLFVVAGANYWLGCALLMGGGLVWRAAEIAAVDHLDAALNQAVGASILLALVGYVAWVSSKPRRVGLRGLTLELPGFWITLGQIAVGAIDILCAASVLYALLPSGYPVEFLTFVAIYVAASVLGVASNAPGGVGAFEATMLSVMRGIAPEALLASLLLFRIVYYVAPFLLALALIGAHEANRQWAVARAAMQAADRERRGATDDDGSG
jgi:uncharacterized membrane protein YbhN (UPF0104 family)